MKRRRFETPGLAVDGMGMRSGGFEQGGKMAPPVSPERPAEMNAVICIFDIDKEEFNGVSSIITDIYHIVWDGCGSLPLRNGCGITAGLDRHFKTNHRLAFPISVLSPQDQQILETRSFCEEFFINEIN